MIERDESLICNIFEGGRQKMIIYIIKDVLVINNILERSYVNTRINNSLYVSQWEALDMNGTFVLKISMKQLLLLEQEQTCKDDNMSFVDFTKDGGLHALYDVGDMFRQTHVRA